MLASKYAEPITLGRDSTPATIKSLDAIELGPGTILASKYADPGEVDAEAAQPIIHPESSMELDTSTTKDHEPTSPFEEAEGKLKLNTFSGLGPGPVEVTPSIPSPVRPASTTKKLISKRGKTCPIRVPGDTSNRIPPLNPLSEADVNARLESFKNAGFNVQGYEDFSGGISCGEYPDPREIQIERDQRNFSTCVPDQAKWEAYQNELTEQKLLALGVTSGDEDTTPGMSRQVSQSYPPLPISPPVPVSSSGSQHMWQSGGSFGATFSPNLPTSTPSFPGSIASPVRSYGNMSRTANLSSQSNFEFPFLHNQATSPMHQAWPSQQGAGLQGVIARGGSPAIPGAIQSFVSMLSPSPDHLSHGFQRGSNPPPWQLKDQTQRTPSRMQMNQTSLNEELDQSAKQVYGGGNEGDSASHWFVDPDQDIVYPTPRGHKHNISETLERELAEKGEYYPGEYVDESPGEGSKRESGAESVPSIENAAKSQNPNHMAIPSAASSTSMSKLNVKAPEFKFDPKTTHSRNSSISKNMFLPTAIKPGPSGRTIGFLPGGFDRGFNVAAPMFQPGMKEFPFTSSSFNFTAPAPASTPARSIGSTPMSATNKAPSLSAGTPSSEVGRIFSQIDFSDIVKQPKKSKAIPIVQPEDSSENESESESDHEDEYGRITQSDARQKRARRAGADGDNIPLFAPTPDVVEKQTAGAISQPRLGRSFVDERISGQPYDGQDLIDMQDKSIDLDMNDLESASQKSSRASLPSPTLPELSADVQSPSQADEIGSDPAGSPSFQEIDAIMEFINSEEPDMIERAARHSGKPLSPAKGLLLETSSPLAEAQQLPSDESDVTDLNVLGVNRDNVSTAVPKDSWTVPDDLSIKEKALRASQSPVRKLNSPGELPNSDWDDVVSSTEETKFQAKTQLFNTPMTTLIESMLKKQLIPLEKKLNEMGEFTRVPLRELSRGGASREGASFVEKTNSDADDEDDSDGPSRSRPQSHKNDRKIELIKSAVLEAMTSSQNPTIHKIEEELSLRYAAERREADTQRLLKLSEEELELYRKSTEDTENKVHVLEKERHEAHMRISSLENASEGFRSKNLELADEVNALQGTLDEYRLSSSKWREEIDEAHKQKQSLEDSIEALKMQIAEHGSIRQSMSVKIKTIQDDMTSALSHSAAERAIWQRKDAEHSKNFDVLSAKLEGASKNKEQLEKEVSSLQAQGHESIKTAVILKETQNANARIEAAMDKLMEENIEYQKTIARLETQTTEAKDNANMEIQRMKALLEADVEVANKKAEGMRTELETRLEMLRNELENARKDADALKEKFEQSAQETAAARADTIREAAQSSSATLQEERSKFKNSLEDLATEHDRARRHILEDKQRSEVRLQDKLDLSNAKIEHLTDKVRHLEDKVSVAQSAAQAAASAAQSARSPAAILPNAIPQSYEKVSPKALRESIAVLQEQLHEREARIEQLEHQISEIGIDAPKKIKERETEIGWLRELLGVRIDDLSELVDTLAQADYDRSTVRNTAIRIRSSLRMEQHEKERLIAGGAPRASIPVPTLADIQSFATPKLADIQNFASPKAAQIAAAWGNWRKGKEPAYSALAQAVSGRIDETPLKASPSAHEFMSGLITPPASNVRKSPSIAVDEDETRIPMLGSTSPSQPKTPTGIIVPGRRRDDTYPPKTPPLMRKASYDQDAEVSTDEFLDEDDSTVDGNSADRTESQPFGPNIAK